MQSAEGGPSEQETQVGDGRTIISDTGDDPVIVLSYAYAGAAQVQNALAAGAGLACTSGTGIIPLCAAAAETWRRIEGRTDTALSSLAAVTVQRLVGAQVTAILAGSGQGRWCELTLAAPGAAETFLQLFPYARFACVHRACLGVIRAAVQANPWGLHGQGLTPYLLAHPGNSIAALAEYWADSAEQLIAFEDANPEATHRIRYEDVDAHPGQALAAMRAAFGLASTAHDSAQPEWLAEPDTQLANVPTEVIPEPLRQRVSRLHAELGYLPPPI